MRIIMAISPGILVMFLCLFIYRKEVKFNYSAKYYLNIIVISFLGALFFSYINPNNMGNLFMFFLLLVVIPYVISSNLKAKNDENDFNDLIIWCNNMIISLKQKQSTNYALYTSSQQLNGKLRDNINNLIENLSEDKRTFQMILEKMIKIYPYTIVKQICIIILAYHYDDSNNIDRLLEVFEEDVNKLVEDVKENQSYRKTLRIQYLGISIGCIVVMWMMSSQFMAMFPQSDTYAISLTALVFYITTIIILFIVDMYFNNHLTEE